MNKLRKSLNLLRLRRRVIRRSIRRSGNNFMDSDSENSENTEIQEISSDDDRLNLQPEDNKQNHHEDQIPGSSSALQTYPQIQLRKSFLGEIMNFEKLVEFSKIIPEFDGDESKLHRFLAACDLVYSKVNDADNQKTITEIIKTKCINKGYEAVKYCDDTVLYDSKDLTKSLKHKLKQSFTKKKSACQIQVELTNTKQNEGVKMFATRIETLLNELTETMISEEGVAAATLIKKINEKAAIKAFERGLKKPLQILIQACRFDNLQDAISRALEEEILLNLEKKPLFCNYCKKGNHSIENCFKRNNNNKNNFNRFSKSTNFQQKFNPNQKNDGAQTHDVPSSSKPSYMENKVRMQCNYCKNIGHSKEECRKKKFADSQKPINSESKNSASLGGGQQTLSPSHRVKNM